MFDGKDFLWRWREEDNVCRGLDKPEPCSMQLYLMPRLPYQEDSSVRFEV